MLIFISNFRCWRLLRAAIFLLKLILSFKIFDLIFVLTAEGPGLDTNLATFKIWRTLFQDFNLGLASAETIQKSAIGGRPMNQ
jgi:ABC-type sugar transport system permease subunit